MEGGIYIIINKVNKKVYVGSAKNFVKRWARHLRDLRAGKHSSVKLQRSFNKHGEDSFSFQSVENVEYEKDIIIAREAYYMELYDSHANGYNIAPATFGDVLTHHPNRKMIVANIKKAVIKRYAEMSPDERKKFSKSGSDNPNYKPHKHRFCSVCGGRLQGNANTHSKCRDRAGVKNPFFGKKHTPETVERLRMKKMGIKPVNTRAVQCEGVIYNSIREAADALGVCNATVVYRCKSDNYPSWLYLNA